MTRRAAWVTIFWIVAFDLSMTYPLFVPSPPLNWTGVEAAAASYSQVPIWLSILPSLLLAPSFLWLVSCLHGETAPEHRQRTRLALALTAVYAALVGLNYTVQLTVVRAGMLSGETDGLALWAMGNPHSIFWALEVVGYGFMGLAAAVAAPGLTSVAARRLFYANALIQVVATAAYFVTVNPFHPLVLISLGIWGVTFPLAIGLLAKRT